MTSDRELPTPDDLRRVAVWVVPGLVVVAIELVAAGLLDIQPRTLLSDPAELAHELPSYAGALTAFTVVMWFSAVTVLGFAAWLVGPAHPLRPVMLSIAGLSAILGLDDRLRLHEGISNALGVSEAVVFLVYGVLAIVIAWRFGRDVWPERWLALTAGVGFAVSLFVDIVIEEQLELYVSGEAFIEENAKLLGTVVWVGFAWHLARRAVETRDREASLPS